MPVIAQSFYALSTLVNLPIRGDWESLMKQCGHGKPAIAEQQKQDPALRSRSGLAELVPWPRGEWQDMLFGHLDGL